MQGNYSVKRLISKASPFTDDWQKRLNLNISLVKNVCPYDVLLVIIIILLKTKGLAQCLQEKKRMVSIL